MGSHRGRALSRMAGEFPGQPITESQFSTQVDRISEVLRRAESLGYPPNPDEFDSLLLDMASIEPLSTPGGQCFAVAIDPSIPVSRRHNRNVWVVDPPHSSSGIIIGGKITSFSRATQTNDEERAFYLDYTSVTMLALQYIPERSPNTRPVDVRFHLGVVALCAVHLVSYANLSKIADRLHPHSRPKSS